MDLRLVQNFSFPHSPKNGHCSINHFISSDDFPCTWETFKAVAFKVATLPPGSQGAIHDVAEAYRNIPVHASQWPGAVVGLPGQKFCVDPFCAFGECLACGVYGRVGDTLVDIFCTHGIGPLSKWVDDHFFLRILQIYLKQYNTWRAEMVLHINAAGGCHQTGDCLWWKGADSPSYPEEFDEDMERPIRDLSQSLPCSNEDGVFSYCFADINALSEELGVPWKLKKDFHFTSFAARYTGILWHLDVRTLLLPSDRREKYQDTITTWLSRPVHTLKQVRVLYGCLLSCTCVVPSGRAYLTGLESMLGIFSNNPFMPRTPPKSIASDLVWWSQILANDKLERRIPGPCKVVDIAAFSDASSSVGIAVVIQGRWRAWRLIPGWNSPALRDIQWAEAIGF